MSTISIRCARLFSAIIILALVASAAAQRPSLRSETADDPPTGTAASENENSASQAFTVESTSPQGPVSPGAIISVTFSKDVVTDKDFDSGDLPQSVFSFEPSIDGALQWESARQVRFVPRRALRQATNYVVRINPLLKSATGDKLAKPVEYRFQTPALTFKSVKQDQFLNDRRVVLSLNFSDKVKPQDLRKYLEVFSGDREIQWSAQSEVASQNPKIITAPMTTDSLRIAIEPGLAGVSGPLGLRSRVEKKLNLKFTLTPVSVTGLWKQGSPRLLVEFSDYINTANAREFISIEPPVKPSFSSDGNTLLISADFEPEKRYAVRVRQGFANNSGKMVLEPAEFSVWMPPLAPFLELPDSSGYLGTNSRMKLRVRTAVINKLTVTARRVFDSNLVYNEVFGSTYNTQRLGRKVAEQTYEIAMTPNAVQTSEIDLRELLGPGATGVYGITVKGETPSEELLVTSYTGNYDYQARQDAELDAQATINLSNLGLISKTGADEVMVFVAALDTAKPLPGISISVYSDKNQLLGEATTDASGIALIKNVTGGDADVSPSVAVARSADKSEVSVLSLDRALMYREDFFSSGRNFLRDGYEVYLTPERGAYRPGETVHVSGFLRGRDSTVPGSAFPVEVILERPDGKKMTPEIKSPSPTGLMSFDISVPDYAPTGQYTLDVRMPGSSEEQNGDTGYDY